MTYPLLGSNEALMLNSPNNVPISNPNYNNYSPNSPGINYSPNGIYPNNNYNPNNNYAPNNNTPKENTPDSNYPPKENITPNDNYTPEYNYTPNYPKPDTECYGPSPNDNMNNS